MNKKPIKKSTIFNLLKKMGYELATFISPQATVLSEIKPSKRYYHVSKVLTTEAGIYHHWFQDFYIVLGNNNDNNWNIRYLLIIVYMLGLAIGVHLLNLLALPFIGLIILFKKFNYSLKSFLLTVLLTIISFVCVRKTRSA